MAQHSSSNTYKGGIDDHRATYEGFVRGAIGLVLICLFVLVALVSFAFGHAWSVFLGFAGLAAGIIGVLVDFRTGSKRWTLSLVLLVLFGLITAINVA
jgi:uncharacterized membrane protein HdeD (DUF308 family)